MDLDWDNYHYTFKNGETAYFKVDPSYADRAPLKALSNLVTCKMLVAHTQRNGSPTDPELQKIADFETKAVEVAKGAGENVYVGWVTSGNLAAVNFYASDGAALVKQLHISIKLLPITQFRCQTKVDAAWGFYLDFLYPPPMMKVHIDDDKRVAVLRRQGDDGVIRRKIEHFASFPTEAPVASSHVLWKKMAFRSNKHRSSRRRMVSGRSYSPQLIRLQPSASLPGH